VLSGRMFAASMETEELRTAATMSGCGAIALTVFFDEAEEADLRVGVDVADWFDWFEVIFDNAFG
ncbi:hypothetical protein KGQ29_04530, partial [Patescibacteria group bacterium]|nr:hypothetical protein [Patescibacteria group bacterium]